MSPNMPPLFDRIYRAQKNPVYLSWKKSPNGSEWYLKGIPYNTLKRLRSLGQVAVKLELSSYGYDGQGDCTSTISFLTFDGHVSGTFSLGDKYNMLLGLPPSVFFYYAEQCVMLVFCRHFFLCLKKLFFFQLAFNTCSGPCITGLQNM